MSSRQTAGAWKCIAWRTWRPRQVRHEARRAAPVTPGLFPTDDPVWEAQLVVILAEMARQVWARTRPPSQERQETGEPADD
jgi:hypothetical protein